MSKLIRQIAVHLSDEAYQQIIALAADADAKPSEYVREVLINPHLERKREQFERMSRVFGALGSESSPGPDVRDNE
jgi:predicted DNA-binding protein